MMLLLRVVKWIWISLLAKDAGAFEVVVHAKLA
jgi:hypothetical protein